MFMAEQMFMFATTAGVMIGLGVLLFVVPGRRSKGMKATIQGHDEGDKGRKVKTMIRMANPFKIKMHYGNN